MITRTAPTWHTQDWQNQLSNAISSVAELLELADLNSQDLPAQLKAHQDFPVKVPRAFARKIEKGNPRDPLLLQVLPTHQELNTVPGFGNDPLQEAQFTPVPGLIHKYRGRVLLTTSTTCAINCRYCFRRHFPYSEHRISQSQMDRILEYLRQDPSINEIIFSGGDPLATSNTRFGQWVQQLEAVPHIKRLRVHTRLPVMIPERIDSQLLNIIDNSRCQWVFVVHCNHHNELDTAFHQAIKLLQVRNVQLLNQSVLLKGVNDNACILAALSETLFQMQVLPYYLHLLDPVAGAAHFDISETRAQSIYQELLGLLPGYLVPTMVRETPQALSKTPICPEKQNVS
ncbi:MAG: EF-P beta-lysylation protein EpmB [Gammaproteobacteria bacterium]|nr:MAG: EF-P beta-lysylation protein EpmB [Gammaproteobacteria bacterium]